MKLADTCKIDVKVARESIVKFLVAIQQKKWGESGKVSFAFKLHQFISGLGVEILDRMHFCRECGREYIPVWVDDKNGMVVPRKLDDTPPDSEKRRTSSGVSCNASRTSILDFYLPGLFDYFANVGEKPNLPSGVLVETGEALSSEGSTQREWVISVRVPSRGLPSPNC